MKQLIKLLDIVPVIKNTAKYGPLYPNINFTMQQVFGPVFKMTLKF